MEFDSLITYVGIIAGAASISAAVYSFLKPPTLATRLKSAPEQFGSAFKRDLKAALEPLSSASKNAQAVSESLNELVSVFANLRKQFLISPKQQSKFFGDLNTSFYNQSDLLQRTFSDFVHRISEQFKREQTRTSDHISVLERERETLIEEIRTLNQTQNLLSERLKILSEQFESWQKISTHEPQSLVSPTEKYKVFLSYAADDEKVAMQIKQVFEKASISTFIATSEIGRGDMWTDAIRQGMLESRDVCLLLTPQSVDSPWLMAEFGMALGMGKKIVPILSKIEHRSIPSVLQSIQAVKMADLDVYINQILGQDS